MPDPAPNAELLQSLGRLARGLSALFWGLPFALIVCVQTAKADWFKSFGVVPPLAVTGLLVYGLWQMGHFQKQERVWRNALDRAQLIGVVNVGLAPFLYWWNKVPAHPFFAAVVTLLAATSLLFLSHLNLILQRLSAMLPDETLRLETKQFTTLNRVLLLITLGLAVVYLFLSRWPAPLPRWAAIFLSVLERGDLWFLIFLVLLPLAMTMALIWKTKEVILHSVFSARP
jgi:hypothetical protein